MLHIKKTPLCLVFTLFLSGCAGIFTLGSPDFRDAVFKIGDAYEIEGRIYLPQRDPRYDATGIASWYGNEFDGRKTANGEVFRSGDISAAHRTLPMPSAVRVTNLDNGRAINIRINDRGPFVRGRIIDISEKGAELLGFKANGTARVRVQALPNESAILEAEARRGHFPEIGLQGGVVNVRDRVTGSEPPPTSLATGDDGGRSAGQGVSALDLIRQSRAAPDVVAEAAPQATQLWIQLGSFRERANAEIFARRIAFESGRGINIAQFDSATGDVLHRVRIGPLADTAAADKTLAELRRLGYTDAVISVE